MLPDMGFLVAQKYKTGVVVLTRHGYSETYFLLEGVPPNKDKLMHLGWVNNDHSMIIHLKSDSLILRPDQHRNTSKYPSLANTSKYLFYSSIQRTNQGEPNCRNLRNLRLGR
jgi:hypothetical protein